MNVRQLFKIDSKDKIRILKIWAHNGQVLREAGVYGGTLVPSGKNSTPKNVGRANETSAEDQAILEADAEVTKKLREGYIEVKSELDLYSDEDLRNLIIKGRHQAPNAMLAKTYDKKKVDLSEGYLASAKLDGMRCLAQIPESGEIVLWTRGGKEIHTMNHIKVQLEELRDKFMFTGVLDGELYIHQEEADNFQQIMSSVKKYRPGISEQMNYCIYDLISGNDALTRRNDYMNVLLEENRLLYPNLIPIPQTFVDNIRLVEKLHEKHLGSGYEGTMLKSVSGSYEGKRSSNLLKMKDFVDQEFPIINVVPMDNRPECGVVVLCTSDGKEFKATPKMSYDERCKLLQNKEEVIGKQGTVTFFSETDDGIPRFPIFKAVRIDGT